MRNTTDDLAKNDRYRLLSLLALLSLPISCVIAYFIIGVGRYAQSTRSAFCSFHFHCSVGYSSPFERSIS